MAAHYRCMVVNWSPRAQAAAAVTSVLGHPSDLRDTVSARQIGFGGDPLVVTCSWLNLRRDNFGHLGLGELHPVRGDEVSVANELDWKRS
jgi:hypothetical protein